MNHTAAQQRKDNDSGEKRRRGFLRRLMPRLFLVLGGIAAGIAFILLAIVVFYPYRNAPLSLWSDLKSGPKVFRAKIPPEIKIRQNLFRAKIPVLDQPPKPAIKIESTPPVEKKEGPSPPTPAAPEKSEVLPETEPHLPAEPQTKIETNLPAEEQPVYSQPTLAPPEPEVLPQKADLHQAEERPQPVEEDASGKTEERIIHREEWLLSQTSSYYTIQLMGVRKEALLFDFVKRNQLLKQDEIAFYQTTFKDKPWFQLLYGVYATKKDAQSATDNLPPKIRESSPWIRRLSGVQKAIRKKVAP